MCALVGVCAAVVSVWSAVLLFEEVTLRVVTLPDRVRLSKRATLFREGECDDACPPQFTVQPRVSGKVRWVPSSCSYPLLGEHTDYGTNSFGVS